MLSGLSFRSSFVFRINSLILYDFPLNPYHLTEAKLVPRAIKKKLKASFLPSSYNEKMRWGQELKSLTIFFFVALYPCLWICPKILENVFLKKVF